MIKELIPMLIVVYIIIPIYYINICGLDIGLMIVGIEYGITLMTYISFNQRLAKKILKTIKNFFKATSKVIKAIKK